ncbi:NUDIX hydrolase [Candidatus Nanohalobium constans]|uniref:NUDIX domain-containing protein n=1 Tax=Candidatus Nanohalobium constans TaxID=2565781 RepID=A0A5Q0UH77_9ARCH|nr:NUDIX hydrolase [Candidatus Nanohalobium constans]QGA80570.1 NUDIX domain-containing protein [Candidatus Nanohalobium constans]
MSQDTKDVVQTVIKSDGEFLIAKRSKDDYWEFMGGKVKEDEDLEEAAIREINEETNLSLEEEDLKNFRRGDAYRSKDNEKYRLNPVHFRIDEEKKDSMTEKGLSNEHTDFEWIDLTKFDEYDTLGQYRALEHLGVVNGRVALAAVRKDGKYLFVKRSPENSSAGRWSFVSGGIEPGENPKEAAVRELREETSLDAEPVEKGEFFIGEGEKGFWRLEPVLMDHVSGEVDLNWELSEFEWLEAEEISDFKTLGDNKAVENWA